MINPKISRRRFLQGTGLVAGGLAASPSWALPSLGARESGFRRLVVIELHGGNDGLNFLAPTGDDLYHRARPNLAIGRKDGHGLDGHHRWHPSLKNLARRYNEGQACVVQGVGTDQPNLSHFRSRDLWYLGDHDTPHKEQSWLGRLADGQWGLDRSPVTLLNVGKNLSPRAMQSLAGRPFSFQNSASSSQAMPPVPRPKGPASPHMARLKLGSKIARQASQALAAIPELETRIRWPRGGVASRLAQVAGAMAHGLPTRVFWVSQSGYDTHSYQGKDHARLLRDLDLGLHAFVAELESRDLLKDTLIMTMSEFGRRVAENGTRDGAGTDHGQGSLQLLMGGGVRGGLLGPRPNLEDLDENGNLKHAHDFRQVNGAVASHWFGAQPTELFGEGFTPITLFEKQGGER